MKRKRKSHRDQRVAKRQKTKSDVNEEATWPLLRQYYPEVLTLRHYLVSRLSKSKKRRRILLHYGLGDDQVSEANVDASVVALLDTTIVGDFKPGKRNDIGTIDNDITVFTQALSDSPAPVSPTQGVLKQPEVGSISPSPSYLHTVLIRPAVEHLQLMLHRSLTSQYGFYSGDSKPRENHRTYCLMAIKITQVA